MILYVVVLREVSAELDVAVAAEVWKVQAVVMVVVEILPASEADGQVVLLKVVHLSICDVPRCHSNF